MPSLWSCAGWERGGGGAGSAEADPPGGGVLVFPPATTGCGWGVARRTAPSPACSVLGSECGSPQALPGGFHDGVGLADPPYTGPTLR